MMHPLAIYAVQVHLADLMAEAEANRLAKLGRKPRTGRPRGLPRRASPATCSVRTTHTAPLRPPDRSHTGRLASLPAGSLHPGPSSGPGAISSRTPAHPPRGGRLGVYGVTSVARGRPGCRRRRGSVRRGRAPARSPAGTTATVSRSRSARSARRSSRRSASTTGPAIDGRTASGSTHGGSASSVAAPAAGSASTAAASSSSTAGTRCGMSPPTTTAAAS